MNVEDSTHQDIEEIQNPMQHVFEKQRSLYEKYKEIEGLPNSLPLSIDDCDHQIILKDFAWRGMEEIAEAMEAFEKNEIIHFKEEMIDALHFFTELNILAGKGWTDFEYKSYKKSEKLDTMGLHYRAGVVLKKYGLVMNCLKNKKWKQSQVLTDQLKFYKLLKDAYETFMRTLQVFGMTYTDIYNMYCRKNEVNQFRIQSKY
jgi:hypothetical protein